MAHHATFMLKNHGNSIRFRIHKSDFANQNQSSLVAPCGASHRSCQKRSTTHYFFKKYFLHLMQIKAAFDKLNSTNDKNIYI